MNNIKVTTTNSFVRNLKKFKKKHYDLTKLDTVVQALISQDTLALHRHSDHALTGKYKGYRELHISSDWLLVYRFLNNHLELLLVDTGSHDDLFK